jgi:capsid protein
MGASMGHVDPLKEANAAATRIANNLTTQEQEASEYNGNNFDEIIKQRKKEVAMQRELAQEAGIPAATEPDETREEDEGEKEDE